jgi:multiple sugar transport system ATP-binding protein
MAYGLTLRGLPKREIDARVEAAAEMLGLSGYLERRPGTLSGGQKQRVALGRAIVREPRAFLMDEPLSNLDAKLRAQMRAEIGRLHDRLHTTTIYVTHDQAEAMTLADRIVAMRAGTIQQFASPETMYDHPANVFVAGFIGSPTMNFIRGRILAGEGGMLIESGTRRIGLDPARRESVVPYQGRAVIAGIRPEHILATAAPSDGAEQGDFSCEVRSIENMGSERFLYMSARSSGIPVGAHAGSEGRDELEQDLLVARETGTDRLRRGDLVSLRIDPATLHLFDAETEQAIR